MSFAENPAFEEYYRRLYGNRWPALRESLLQPSEPLPYDTGLCKPYYLDSASVLAAASLRLPEKNGAVILDACAAPGGKTLVLASRMEAGTTLLANELSTQRRRRLLVVLDEHLPPERRAKVTVSGFNAAAAAGRISERERFAAILLDAPCSSERHVLQDAKALAQWKAGRPRFLAVRQWALLSAAFLLLQSGGSLVYATCALTPEENDGVAGRLLEKYGAQCIVDKPDFSEGEATEYGRIMLPDLSRTGPMYVARFKKAL